MQMRKRSGIRRKFIFFWMFRILSNQAPGSKYHMPRDPLDSLLALCLKTFKKMSLGNVTSHNFITGKSIQDRRASIAAVRWLGSIAKGYFYCWTRTGHVWPTAVTRSSFANSYILSLLCSYVRSCLSNYAWRVTHVVIISSHYYTTLTQLNLSRGEDPIFAA